MTNLSLEIHRKLQLIDQLRAEAKALREEERAAAELFNTRRKAAIKEMRSIMRQHKLVAADLVSA